MQGWHTTRNGPARIGHPAKALSSKTNRKEKARAYITAPVHAYERGLFYVLLPTLTSLEGKESRDRPDHQTDRRQGAVDTRRLRNVPKED